MTGPREFRIDVDWESAPGVATPEFRATWAQLAIWCEPHSITAVEDSRDSYRRAVYTTVYPLAEWIAFNWWALTAGVRPSALPLSVWKWSNGNEWLKQHNLRGVGSGMPWPDLTFVPEGAMTRAVWRSGPGLAGQPVAFLSSGDAYLQTHQFVSELTHFVDTVMDRLREAGVQDTPLAKEWQSLREIHQEEAEFAQAAARLGLDPYAMSTEAQDNLIAISDTLDDALMEEFLDSADPEQLGVAARWLQQARDKALNFVDSESSSEFRSVDLIANWRLEGLGTDTPSNDARPWTRGYAAARQVRAMLRSKPTDSLNMDSLVPKLTLTSRSAGLEGYTRFSPMRQLVLVLPSGSRVPASVRFAQARSLGLIIASDRDEHLLDPASTDLSKEARAFAAELLAPAAGISDYLSTLPAVTDAAFDAVAARFRTSSWLIRHQYENQIAGIV
jgi:hypothetical protein